MKTHEIVAVKVVKNKPAYFNQSMMEVTILELVCSFLFSSGHLP
jgi:dual specificity protein kinase YAK1